MTDCLFVSDLHGNLAKYEKLFYQIEKITPEIVLIGGDILPLGFSKSQDKENSVTEFINDFLSSGLSRLKKVMGQSYPQVVIIFGNDDPKIYQRPFTKRQKYGLWHYLDNSTTQFKNWQILGYSYITPSPFRLKDWERYDVSRYVDPGCTSPEEGTLSIERPYQESKYTTIADDLNKLTRDINIKSTIFLFHCPPYKTLLDRANLDDVAVDGVPVDPHIGSIAIKRFIEDKQPPLTLHGHVHESAELTGSWKCKIENSYCFSAAHTGEELAIISFDIGNLESAERILI